jgi:hypothetical protein
VGETVFAQGCVGGDDCHGLSKTSLSKDLPFRTIHKNVKSKKARCMSRKGRGLGLG